MIDSIAAGIETLANTLIFVLNYVTTSHDSPANLATAQMELMRVIWRVSFIPTHVYRKRIEYVPTAFCLAWILPENATLSGYGVKAGTVIFCQNMISCHDPNTLKIPIQRQMYATHAWYAKCQGNIERLWMYRMYLRRMQDECNNLKLSVIPIRW